MEQTPNKEYNEVVVKFKGDDKVKARVCIYIWDERKLGDILETYGEAKKLQEDLAIEEPILLINVETGRPISYLQDYFEFWTDSKRMLQQLGFGPATPLG